jgi:hypothetical protein
MVWVRMLVVAEQSSRERCDATDYIPTPSWKIDMTNIASNAAKIGSSGNSVPIV